MTPITRKEQFYNAILNGTEAPKPVTREEQFWNAILNGTEAPKPVTREEMWLAQIAANGGGGGGGGSSSFVEAKVTLEFAEGTLSPFFYGRPDGYNGIGALIYDKDYEYWTYELTLGTETFPSTVTFDTIIIDGVGGVIYAYNEVEVTGSATVEPYYDEFWIHVTGDCTISLIAGD